MKSGVLSFVVLAASLCSAQLQAPPRQLVFRAGYDNGPALVNLQLQGQKRLVGFTQIAVFQYIIWQCDAGASSMQFAYRRGGVQNVFTPVLVPTNVGSVSGTIACASWDGNNRTWEGNSVPCSRTGSFGFAIGDTLETTNNPVADGVSKSCSAFVVAQ